MPKKMSRSGRAGIEILTTHGEFEEIMERLGVAFFHKAAERLASNAEAAKIRQYARNQFLRAIKRTEDWQGITGETSNLERNWRAVFGIEIEPIHILRVLEKSIQFAVDRRVKKPTIFIGIWTADTISKMFNEPEMSVVTRAGEVIPWMEWLSTGVSDIINEYRIVMSTSFADTESRSGMALMFHDPYNKMTQSLYEYIGKLNWEITYHNPNTAPFYLSAFEDGKAQSAIAKYIGNRLIEAVQAMTSEMGGDKRIFSRSEVQDALRGMAREIYSEGNKETAVLWDVQI